MAQVVRDHAGDFHWQKVVKSLDQGGLIQMCIAQQHAEEDHQRKHAEQEIVGQRRAFPADIVLEIALDAGAGVIFENVLPAALFWGGIHGAASFPGGSHRRKHKSQHIIASRIAKINRWTKRRYKDFLLRRQRKKQNKDSPFRHTYKDSMEKKEDDPCCQRQFCFWPTA